ncbi:Hypothetical predicted protein [Pelobates cultripes]|uniref:Uncharacterized protein n=1 Tax=Pelobates cultripes TaxID=61616 RepID=A0AAD1WR10_PELCU|nr:Hypothetical predicted protein [Pelobates cultripes]
MEGPLRFLLQWWQERYPFFQGLQPSCPLRERETDCRGVYRSWSSPEHLELEAPKFKKTNTVYKDKQRRHV